MLHIQIELLQTWSTCNLSHLRWWRLHPPRNLELSKIYLEAQHNTSLHCYPHDLSSHHRVWVIAIVFQQAPLYQTEATLASNRSHTEHPLHVSVLDSLFHSKLCRACHVTLSKAQDLTVAYLPHPCTFAMPLCCETSSLTLPFLLLPSTMNLLCSIHKPAPQASFNPW